MTEIANRIEALRVKFISDFGLEPNLLVMGRRIRYALETIFWPGSLITYTEMKLIDNADDPDYLSVAYELTETQPEE